ncbi:hypothetical protein AB0E86_32155 [Streptomyces narbonensis]
MRYHRAVGGLNVCGGWYDLVGLPGDRTAVAVGDVVGHGLIERRTEGIDTGLARLADSLGRRGREDPETLAASPSRAVRIPAGSVGRPACCTAARGPLSQPPSVDGPLA